MFHEDILYIPYSKHLYKKIILYNTNINFEKCFLLVICIAEDFIWTTLKAMFSIF